jgi:hypothetical protein
MDYLRRSARISRMDKIRNKAIRTKMGIKKNFVKEIQEQQLRWYGHIKRRTEKLLNRLQNGSHRGKGSEVDQSTHGRMESERV